ncbi:LOW QUALITY PROTEIN: olfactory receptor 11H4-like [Sphaerodactylus townsendi]|uniref:LOW QUALITY PROTEIN: olfactory receptor 11H4-like n=1 Tax=Sphaerodactylus townsendi TaxID=933632 RepID=UPI002025C73B|nr:LOW QUALITY PROTEIN: olfactory receptor 11H4-like [Sphaerodactylus townsendi]
MLSFNQSKHMQRDNQPLDPVNTTNRITEFVLLGFLNLSPLFRLVLASLLSIGYTFTLVGNFCIVWAILRDSCLSCRPMYILLGNFSGLEMCYVTTTVPRMLLDLTSPSPGTISFRACFLQFYFFFSMGTTESFLLAAMALDRYLAICHPLRYPVLMSQRFCYLLAASCWLSGFLWFLTPVALISQLCFCGPNVLNHFLCDPGPLLSLSCTPAPRTETTFYSLRLSIAIFPERSLLHALCSYTAVSAAGPWQRWPFCCGGRQKGFSTCSSHLAVVSLFYGSIMATYVVPEASGSSSKVVTCIYALMTPLLNPLIL